MQVLEQRRKVIMAVDDNPDILMIIRASLTRRGFEVVTAESGQEALDTVGKVLPDLILLDIMMPRLDGSSVLTELRARAETNYIPVIMLSALSDEKNVTDNLGLGADDYITKPFGIEELVARVKAKIDRPPVPASHIMGNLQTELVNEAIFNEEVGRELERAKRSNSNGCIAYLELVELPQATQQFGTAAVARIERQVAGILKKDNQPLELFGWNGKGRYLILLPDLSAKTVRQRLEGFIRQIAATTFEFENQTGINTLHFTPILGYCMFEDGDDTRQLTQQTQQALRNASVLLDIQPYRYQANEVSTGKGRKVQDYVGNIFQQLQFSIQAFLVVLIGGVVPYFLYLGLDASNVHIDTLIYVLIVVNYLFLGLVIWAEGLLAGKTEYPPDITDVTKYPSASAIITAYLPECAPTIIETLEKYLAIDYPGELKIILAYNTPQKLPIEERLALLAQRDSRLILHKVENSTTKSQNINSALANCVNSEFTGIFEPGDHPDPNIFQKAARWINAGYDVIQGHNLIRNGETSYISRLSAVESESYYAASLPGKIRLGKGLVFGGTNNFWRTSVLRQTRLRIAEESSVTELVMRVALEGYKIAYDPQLVSRRLAPVSWKNWGNGLIKRAQGWYQVMLRHTWLVMWDNKLTLQQKLGYNYSLVWREISRWLYLQVYPLSLFYITLQDYQSALFLFLVVFLFIGPSQTLLTYLHAHPDIRRNKGWFIEYFFATTFYFVELKRFLACIGQIRELLGEPFTHPAISYQILEDSTENEALPVPLPPARSILVVSDEPDVLIAIGSTLADMGYRVLKAGTGAKALATMQNQLPDLIIIDYRLPGMDGLTLLKRIRYQPSIAHIPVVMLGENGNKEDILLAFKSGADDYIAKPIRYPEFMARIKAKLERPTIPGEIVDQDLTTGLPSPQFFRKIIEHEIKRADRLNTMGCLACLNFEETDSLIAKYGNRVKKLLARQVQTIFMAGAQPLDRFGMDEKGNFLLLLPDCDTLLASETLRNLATRIVNHTFNLVDDQIRLTPVTGFSSFGETKKTATDLVRQAETALRTAEVSHDLHPELYKHVPQPLHQPETPPENEPQDSRAVLGEFWENTKKRLVLPSQIALTYIISFFIPLLVYFGLDGIGVNITSTVYLIVVVSLFITAALIWVEGFSALSVKNNPPPDALEYPPAVAIIAAYLPNEAATVVETIQSFLRLQYPGDLKIILAYNTPRPLPVEKILAEMAKEYPRFQAVKVENSTSKAQNVNAVLGMVNSEFVGVFDADHHPDPDSFKRAWYWMEKGYDVVQGHCLVRNGDASWVAKTVAVEFEAIYAVSHPGRAKLHNFGIFGGSNGYWRTNLLRQTRMHGFMLTEDIDSSIRVVLEGYKIASDPFLVSRELATVTLKTLWNQRIRWAQGWFQVSLKHTWTSLTTPRLNFRQKLGMLHLLAWRELYPWIAGQVIPIMIFWIWKYGGIDRIDWLVPVLIMTTLFTMSVAPGQTILSYLRADPEIKQRKKWFFFYLLISMIFYTEYKNLIARVAQVKEILLERHWKVTPRPTAKDATPPTS